MSENIFDYQALLFDLDGVITPTAELHRQAWNRMFTAFLAERGVAPYTEQDYFDYLDGRRRDEGVSALVDSRNIELPMGSEDDGPEVDSVHGLGARKNQDFLALLEEGIAAYPGSLELLEQIRTRRNAPQIAIVSSSKNARPVLRAAGLEDRFAVIVDGLAASVEALPGKPQPDTYLYAARQLGVTPEDAVVLEDATSGVASGAAGKFGLVIGVDRGTGRQALLDAGADIVVDDLADLLEPICRGH